MHLFLVLASNVIINFFNFLEKCLVDDLFFWLGIVFASIMMILLVKYAKFIHVQPKVEAERRKMKEEGIVSQDENSEKNP